MYENKLPRMRTIPQAYNEIKKIDPNTSLSNRALRKLILEDKLVPTVKVSETKKLINLDLLLQKLSCYNETKLYVLDEKARKQAH